MSRRAVNEIYTWQSFIAFAESYGEAAFYSSQLALLHDAPVGALACHSMELALKAVLLSRGASAAGIVDYRHDLARLFRDTGLDCSDVNGRAISFYAQAVLN